VEREIEVYTRVGKGLISGPHDGLTPVRTNSETLGKQDREGSCNERMYRACICIRKLFLEDRIACIDCSGLTNCQAWLTIYTVLHRMIDAHRSYSPFWLHGVVVQSCVLTIMTPVSEPKHRVNTMPYVLSG
jgi:hypothetical protein